MVFYCGKTCQIAHWKAHKATCSKLAAAASPILASLDVFDRISQVVGPLSRKDIKLFQMTVDDMNNKRSLSKLPSATYPSISGILHRLALHDDAAESHARASEGSICFMWVGLASVVLNTNRLVLDTTKWVIDVPLCQAALAHVPSEGCVTALGCEAHLGICLFHTELKRLRAHLVPPRTPSRPESQPAR